MARITMSVLGLSTTAVCLLAACSWTTLTGSWQDEDYSAGPLSSVMVIGVARQQQNQRIFEDEFVKRLRGRNVRAVASYRIFDDVDALTREEVEAEVEKSNIDAVLITEVVGSRTETVQHPSGRSPYGGGWHRYYSSSYDYTHNLPTASRFEVVSLDSKIFYMATGKVIWSASFDTVLEGSTERHIKSFIGQCMKSLRKADLID